MIIDGRSLGLWKRGALVHALPTWLRRCHITDSPVNFLATSGLRVLLEASLLAGTARRYDGSRLKFNERASDWQLGGFHQRLNVRPSDLSVEPLAYLRNVEVEHQIVIPLKIKFFALFLGPAEHDHLFSLSHHAVFQALMREGTFHRKVRKEDLIRIATFDGGNASTEAHAATRTFWNKPLSELVQLARQTLLIPGGEEGVVSSRDLDALTLLGVVTVALRFTHQCRWCFRWSIPGWDLCDRHSQSERGAGDPNARLRRYREGERASKSFVDCDGPPIPLLRPSKEREDMAFFFGRVLWRVTAPDEQALSERLVGQLRDTNYGGLLGLDTEGLTISGVDDFLRQHLEPEQFLPVHWEWKVSFALLMKLEREYASLSREGKSPTVGPRIEEAIRLATEHKCHTLRSLATLMRVDPSTVSHWIGRSADPQRHPLSAVIERNKFLRTSRPH